MFLRLNWMLFLLFSSSSILLVSETFWIIIFFIYPLSFLSKFSPLAVSSQLIIHINYFQKKLLATTSDYFLYVLLLPGVPSLYLSADHDCSFFILCSYLHTSPDYIGGLLVCIELYFVSLTSSASLSFIMCFYSHKIHISFRLETMIRQGPCPRFLLRLLMFIFF